MIFLILFKIMSVRLLIPIILFCLKNSEETEVNYFGPYEVDWNKFETCKGIKRNDCGNIRIENTKNMSNLLIILDFPKDCPITKGKVTAGSMQSKNRASKKLWNYNLERPCQHFVLGPILKDAFNLNKTCKITKGNYEVHLNMNETCKKFLGHNFFYGTYLFKMMAHNNVNNFFCFSTEFDIVKL